nr:PTS transporter subunit EIIC [Escherichia coli]
MQLEKMITEGSNAASAEIDRVSTLEMCRIINDEDKTVPLAVERVLPDIAAAIDVIHAQVSGGGRLIYLGAGTSGRLGILDASECPPTYGVKPGLVVGVHQGFIPVYLALMDSQGFNSLFPILSMAGAGQVGAALALYWRAQPHSALRSQVRGAIIPGLLGVGEPLIYGVTLPRMKPFITACLGGAAGGLFIGLIAWWGLPMGLNSAFGPSGLVALPLMTSAQGILPAMAVYAGGILVAWVCGFIFTTLFGCRNVNLD